MIAGSLPLQATPFIGREAELAQIAQLLNDPACRLLTLVGSGGIGKTRLALQAVANQPAHFPQGVHFVSLTPVASPDLIPSAIAVALGFTFYSADDPRMQILQYLRDQQLLLVIDNFEHVLEGTTLLGEILQSG